MRFAMKVVVLKQATQTFGWDSSFFKPPSRHLREGL
jgi:hypothetical protein